MAFFTKRVAGAGYVVLNVIRAMNITTLLAVIAASSVMLVRTFNNNTFFFFDACEHVVRSCICGFLILTELPLFKQYWARKWPLFSHSSGFVMLGTSMLLIGNSVLANLNKENASQDQLGLPFWRLVIGSGIVIIVMGSVNILASYIFRDTHQGLTARQVRSFGATASHKAEVASSIAASTPNPSRRSRYRSFFLKTEKRNSLPSYHAADSTHPTNPINRSGISRSNTVMTQRQNNNNNDNHHIVSPVSPYNVGSPYSRSASMYKSPNGKQRDITPISPSSKYSCDSPRRPDLAHHPAMNGRPF